SSTSSTAIAASSPSLPSPERVRPSRSCSTLPARPCRSRQLPPNRLSTGRFPAFPALSPNCHITDIVELLRGVNAPTVGGGGAPAGVRPANPNFLHPTGRAT